MRRSVPLRYLPLGGTETLCDVVVAGGGIGGMTFALSAHRLGFKVGVYEANSKDNQFKENAGGGIALWPPSQKVMAQLGILDELLTQGASMPRGGYRNSKGELLAGFSDNFASRFDLLCIERTDLLKTLSRACKERGILVRENSSVTGYRLEDSAQTAGGTEAALRVQIQGQDSVSADMLIAADGIHSKVRRLVTTSHYPPVKPKSCGYAYFRATVPTSNLVAEENPDPSAVAGFHRHTFEAWGSGARFGYVPMKAPNLFWFGAIAIGTQGLEAKEGAHLIDATQKQWLVEQFKEWKGPEGVGPLAHLIEGSTEILRTDIYKVPGTTKFPWHAADGRVVLLGDACHATAPNLAQGAGLAIEDASDLAHRLYYAKSRSAGPFLSRSKDAKTEATATLAAGRSWDAHRQAAVQEYERLRKKRAWAVQTLADLVAVAGQQNGTLGRCRDGTMKGLTKHCPSLFEGIFENVVSYATGGNANRVTWEPSLSSWLHPSIPQQSRDLHYSNISRLLGSEKRELDLLPQVGRQFRGNPLGGHGKGKVTVSFGDGMLVKGCRFLCGLPPAMDAAGFEARVEPLRGAQGAHKQRWTRRFGENYYYSTTMQIRTQFEEPTEFGRKYLESSPCPTRGLLLGEGCGFGYLDKLVSFSYEVIPNLRGQDSVEHCSVTYRSTGMLLGGFRLNWWKSLTPQSSWVETPLLDQGGEQIGWTFDGVISLPQKLGGQPLMHYKGDFVPDPPSAAYPELPTSTSTSTPTPTEKAVSLATPKRHVIVLGSTGLLGSKLVEVLVKDGETKVIGVSRTVETDVDSVQNQSSMLDFLAGEGSRRQTALWSGNQDANVDTLVALFAQCNVDQELVLVNLSGENPGAKRWNTEVMLKVQNSRLRVIECIRLALAKARKEGVRVPCAVLQASAVGIYGPTGPGERVVETKEKDTRFVVSPGANTGDAAEGRKFRVSCCKRLEDAVRTAVNVPVQEKSAETATALRSPTTTAVNLRLGHVFSMKDGALPWLSFAAKCGATSIGGGQQNVPWIHVEDAAESIAALCASKAREQMKTYYAEKFAVPTLFSVHSKTPFPEKMKSLGFGPDTFPVNITAPGSLTQKDLLAAVHNDQKAKHLWKLPAFFPMPGGIFAKAVGPAASVFLDSAHCPPESLIKSGAFAAEKFKYKDIHCALQSWECSLPHAK